MLSLEHLTLLIESYNKGLFCGIYNDNFDTEYVGVPISVTDTGIILVNFLKVGDKGITHQKISITHDKIDTVISPAYLDDSTREKIQEYLCLYKNITNLNVDLDSSSRYVDLFNYEIPTEMYEVENVEEVPKHRKNKKRK